MRCQHRIRSRRACQRGFTLMELVAFAAILSIVAIAAVPLVQNLQGAAESSAAGEQLRDVARASGQYIKAHYAALQSIANPTTAASIAPATLQAEGFLPGAGLYRNPWRQTYTLYVLQPSAGNLLGVVLTQGGRSAPAGSTRPEDIRFAEVMVPGAARRAGATGGFVSAGNIAGAAAGRLYGAAGGWQLDIGGTNIGNPGPGHLAALVYFAAGDLVDDALYRVAVPGNADANRMHVTLDMNGNNITNAGAVSAAALSGTTVNAGTLTATTMSAGALAVTGSNALTVNGRAVGSGLVGWSGLVQQLQPQIPLPGSAQVACPTASSTWSYVAIPTNWMPNGSPQPVGGTRTRLEQSGGFYAARMQLAISAAWQDADPNSQAWILILCGNGT